jgi:predicted TIM-barrel fold metal-dependent hydrolase
MPAMGKKFRFGTHDCGPFCCTSRRAFIGGGVAAAGALAMPGILRAQPTPAGRITAIAQKAVVDVHHHFVPPEYLTAAADELAKSGAMSFPPYAKWTPAATLDEMDRNNVGTAVLSISTPGIWFGDDAQGRRLARICNDYAAKMQADHPGRFGLFAAIPLPDTAGSMTELSYGLDTLKADGIGLMTSYSGRYLGDQSFWPVYEELNRRKAVLYVHPASPNCCNLIKDEVNPSFIEFPTDSTRTILSLLYSGTFQKFRDLRFIFSHNGGTMPLLINRVMQLGQAPGDRSRIAPADIPGELRRHYYEVANSANRASVGAVMQMADPAHMLFGSDYPYVPVGATEGGLLNVGLSDNEIQAILRDNALALLPGMRRA